MELKITFLQLKPCSNGKLYWIEFLEWMQFKSLATERFLYRNCDGIICLLDLTLPSTLHLDKWAAQSIETGDSIQIDPCPPVLVLGSKLDLAGNNLFAFPHDFIPINTLMPEQVISSLNWIS